MVQVPEDLVNLHKDIYLKVYLFFVKGIPLFISLSRKYYIQLSTILLKEKWRQCPRPSKRYIVIKISWVPHHNSSFRLIICPTTIYGLHAQGKGIHYQYHKRKWTRYRYWTPNQNHLGENKSCQTNPSLQQDPQDYHHIYCIHSCHCAKRFTSQGRSLFHPMSQYHNVRWDTPL